MIHHWKDVTRAATTTAATNTEVMFDALHPCDKHSRFDRPVHALISDPQPATHLWRFVRRARLVASL